MMKRLTAIVCAMLVTVSAPMTVGAAGTVVYVTEPAYTQIIKGGVDDLMLFTAEEADGTTSIGTMTSQGEQSRMIYSSAAWDELVKDNVWKTTVHGDAGSLCPYVGTHGSNTVCPYLEIDLVTVTNTQTGVAMENQYVPTKALSIFPSGGAHICWGRYGYKDPTTLKWNTGERYAAMKNADGLWGVFDTEQNAMAVAYTYQNMSAVCGNYAKVSDGTAWGCLDVTSTAPIDYTYTDEAAFSITEELRTLSDGTLQVYNADNEPISAVFAGDYLKTSYSPEAHLLLVTNADNTQSLYDLNGEIVGNFDQTEVLSYLQETCYAVSTYDASGQYVGVALLRVDDVVQPDDTVLKGDANLDKTVNSSDVRAALCAITGASSLTNRQQAAADVDNDDDVDTTDAREILNMILFG